MILSRCYCKSLNIWMILKKYIFFFIHMSNYWSLSTIGSRQVPEENYLQPQNLQIFSKFHGYWSLKKNTVQVFDVDPLGMRVLHPQSLHSSPEIKLKIKIREESDRKERGKDSCMLSWCLLIPPSHYLLYPFGHLLLSSSLF